MVAGKRKKKFSIKFELTPAGLLGVGVVCFCIFLWMFLLGVWAGQTVLSTGRYRVARWGKGGAESRTDIAPGKGSVETMAPAARPKPAETAAVAQPVGKPKKILPSPPALAGVDDSSCFTVQVGAYREVGYAAEALKEWRAKGYKVFSRPPEGQDDKYTRVYIGRFKELAEARKEAEILGRQEKIKPFIATIPAGSVNNP